MPPLPASRELPLLLTVALAAAAPLPADSLCAGLREGAGGASGSSIGITVEGPLRESALERAIGAWAACAAYGSGFPSLRRGGVGTRQLRVRFDPDAVGDARCGAFSGRTITLYARMRSWRGSLVPCGSLWRNLAHELGHALGLRDAPPSCDTFMMAKINRHNGAHRAVQEPECRLLEERWTTAAERLSLPARAPASRSRAALD